MHSIKDIRSNFDQFKTKIKTRNVDINLDEILNLDKKNRSLIQEKETFEKEKKDISKIKDKSLFTKSKEITEKIISINEKQSDVKKKLDNILSSLPNIPLDDVPIGLDESFNKEVTQIGEIKISDAQQSSESACNVTKSALRATFNSNKNK